MASSRLISARSRRRQPLAWFIAVALTALVAGCGGSHPGAATSDDGTPSTSTTTSASPSMSPSPSSTPSPSLAASPTSTDGTVDADLYCVHKHVLDKGVGYINEYAYATHPRSFIFYTAKRNNRLELWSPTWQHWTYIPAGLITDPLDASIRIQGQIYVPPRDFFDLWPSNRLGDRKTDYLNFWDAYTNGWSSLVGTAPDC